MTTHNSQLKTQNSHLMTLVEILVATAILALGMMGILSLVPYAIRNTTSSLHKSVGGSVARSVAVSLRNYSLDLSRIDDWSQGGLDGSEDLVDQLGSISNGYKIPEDLPADDTPYAEESVPFQMKNDAGDWVDSDYRWTGALTEHPTDDKLILQVAVWRKYKLIADENALEITFNEGSKAASVGNTPSGFWDAIDAGDYVRNYDNGVWYRISAIDSANDEILLSTEASIDSDPDNEAQSANSVNLISLYTTTIP